MVFGAKRKRGKVREKGRKGKKGKEKRQKENGKWPPLGNNLPARPVSPEKD
jgi:hypothetical protein